MKILNRLTKTFWDLSKTLPPCKSVPTHWPERFFGVYGEQFFNLESISVRSATGRNAASVAVTQDTRLEWIGSTTEAGITQSSMTYVIPLLRLPKPSVAGSNPVSRSNF